MSEKMTRISLPGERGGLGFLEWGEKPAAEMIEKIRAAARRLRKEADIIESFGDDDFRIEVVRGPLVQRHIKTIQEGKGISKQVMK